MKKKIFLIVALAALGISANAQWFDFSNNNERFGFGFQLGQSASGTEYATLGWGFSMHAYGVYMDVLMARPDHEFDNHVTNTLYRDSASYNIQLGYMIPVLPWLRVMPLIGYSQTNYGDTDATTVNISTDGESSSIYHDYTVVPGSRKHYFNFGVGVSVSPMKYFDLYAVYTAHAIYGGISLSISGRALRTIDD